MSKDPLLRDEFMLETRRNFTIILTRSEKDARGNPIQVSADQAWVEAIQKTARDHDMSVKEVEAIIHD